MLKTEADAVAGICPRCGELLCGSSGCGACIHNPAKDQVRCQCGAVATCSIQAGYSREWDHLDGRPWSYEWVCDSCAHQQEH